MIIPEIVTERLLLRAFKEDDLKAYSEMCADVETMKYIGKGKPLSTEESWRSMAFILGHWLLRGYGLWAVEEKDSGHFIGRVGLFYPEGWPGIEVGWTLVRSFWGRGYATEAAESALKWGFANTQVQELISLIIPENQASIKVSQRLGQTFSKQVVVHERIANLYSISKPIEILC